MGRYFNSTSITCKKHGLIEKTSFKVFKALKQDDDLSANATIANKDVVLKVQKPARSVLIY
jgi:hypothetical protein